MRARAWELDFATCVYGLSEFFKPTPTAARNVRTLTFLAAALHSGLASSIAVLVL